MEFQNGKIIAKGQEYEIKHITIQVMLDTMPTYIIDMITIKSDAPDDINEQALDLLYDKLGYMHHFVELDEEEAGEPMVSKLTGVPSYRIDTVFTF